MDGRQENQRNAAEEGLPKLVHIVNADRAAGMLRFDPQPMPSREQAKPRRQVRLGWGDIAAPAEAQQRDAVKPFDGFHRYVTPKVFQS